MLARFGLLKHTRKLRTPFPLDTAGGLTQCDSVIDCEMMPLDEAYVTAHVLDSTPPVISVGRLCIDHKYEFYWPPGSKNPYFITPKGKRIDLTVDDYIPYICSKDPALNTPRQAATACPARGSQGESEAEQENRPTPTESQVREREANESQAKEMAREALQAVANESEDPRNHKNWIYATEGALHPLWEFESLGGPKLKQMISRLTLDRRTNETIESVSDINLDRDGQTATDKALRVGGNFLNAPRDIVTFVTYVGELPPRKVEEVIPPPPPPVVVPKSKARRTRNRADLKREAQSHQHKLLHFPKNDYCPTCQLAKMQRTGARRKNKRGTEEDMMDLKEDENKEF